MKKIFTLFMSSVALLMINCAVQTPTKGPACNYPAGSVTASQLQSKTISVCHDFTNTTMSAADTTTATSTCTSGGGTWDAASGCNSAAPHSCKAVKSVTGTGTYDIYFTDTDIIGGVASYTLAQVACQNIAMGTWK